jgi:hypothetical protein
VVVGLQGAEEAEKAVAEGLADGVGDFTDEGAEDLGDGRVAAQGGVGHDVEHLAAEDAVLTEDTAHEGKAAAHEGKAAAQQVATEDAVEDRAHDGKTAAEALTAEEAAAQETAAQETAEQVAAQEVAAGEADALEGRGVRVVGSAEQAGMGGGAHDRQSEGEGRRDGDGAPGRFEHVATPSGGDRGAE